MAMSIGDWKFVDAVVQSLTQKAKLAQSQIPTLQLPSIPPDSADDARKYLQDLAQRFAIAESIVLSLAKEENNPAYQLGREMGTQLILGAKRAAKIAREVGSDLAEQFDKTAERLHEGGLTFAKSIGFGAGFALILLLIVVARKL